MAKFGRRKDGRAYPKGRKAYTQRGRSDTKRDRELHARAPGWRGKGKNRYFENRKNRSDARGSRI